MCLRGLSRGVGSAQLPLASSIRKRLIGPTWGVNSRIPVSAMDLHFFFEISLQPKRSFRAARNIQKCLKTSQTRWQAHCKNKSCLDLILDLQSVRSF